MTLTEVKQVMRYHLVGGEGTEDEEQVPRGWRRGVMRMGRWGKEDHRCRRKRKEKGKKMDSFCDQWYLRMAECETILRSGLCLKIE